MKGIALKFVVFCVVTAAAQAQLIRTAVSVNGSDLNTCTVTSPCRTFTRAISQTNPGGEVVALTSGGYGPFTVDRSLTVEAAPGVYAAIAPSADEGITVDAGPTDVVVLRGLHLVGGGGSDNGIWIKSEIGSTHIENFVIHGFTNSGIFYWKPGKHTVKDTTIRKTGSGIVAYVQGAGTNKVTVDHSRIEKTAGGGAVSVGVGTTLTIRDSVAASNQHGFGIGPIAVGGSAVMNIENCMIFDTDFNGVSAHAFPGTPGSAIVRLSNTFITDSRNYGVYAESGTTIFTFENNKIHGNNTDLFTALTPVAQE